MLEVDGLTVSYGGGAVALEGLSLSVDAGECVALIGANGAGKSTTLRAVTGLETPAVGTIRFEGEDITRLPAHHIVTRGIVMVPEQRQLFPHLSVLDNLRLGAFSRRDRGPSYVSERTEEVLRLFPALRERLGSQAGSLSGGQQQMVAVGRGLMADPKLLILDEPSLGLAPQIIDQIFSVVSRLHREQGTSILLVEQNARFSLEISERAYVLERGKLALSGASSDLAADPAVQEHYLGMPSGGDGPAHEVAQPSVNLDKLVRLFAPGSDGGANRRGRRRAPTTAQRA